MTAAAVEMLDDLDKETVDFQPNYDESRVEPKVLPGRFPNLLINGGAGIAVAMASSIPPTTRPRWPTPSRPCSTTPRSPSPT